MIHINTNPTNYHINLKDVIIIIYITDEANMPESFVKMPASQSVDQINNREERISSPEAPIYDDVAQEESGPSTSQEAPFTQSNTKPVTSRTKNRVVS